MAANVYECMFLLDPGKVAGDVAAATKQLKSLLEKHHAEVLASRPWDERRLAYSVNGHKKGLYYLTFIRMDGKNIPELERDFALNETIIRQLILRIHPKYVETLLAIAKDEHALALQVAPEAEGGDSQPPDFDSRRGPRRPRD